MSYLIMETASNATPESFQLTSTIDTPRIYINGSYIPLTTNSDGGGNLKWKIVKSDTTYYVMRTSTSSYSQSASASATYLTTANASDGLSNVTNLTRASTSATLTRASTSNTLTQSSISGYGTAQEITAYTGYSSQQSDYYTSSVGKGNMWNITDLYIDRVSDDIDPNDARWTNYQVLNRASARVEVTYSLGTTQWYTPNWRSTVSMWTYEYWGWYSTYYTQAMNTWIGGDNINFTRYTFYMNPNNGDRYSVYNSESWRGIDGEITGGYAGTGNQAQIDYFTHDDLISWSYTQNGNYSTDRDRAQQKFRLDPITYYRGTSRSTTGYSGISSRASYYLMSLPVADYQTAYLSSRTALTRAITTAVYTRSSISGYETRSSISGYGTKVSTSGYSGVSSSSSSSSESASGTCWR